MSPCSSIRVATGNSSKTIMTTGARRLDGQGDRLGGIGGITPDERRGGSDDREHDEHDHGGDCGVVEEAPRRPPAVVSHRQRRPGGEGDDDLDPSGPFRHRSAPQYLEGEECTGDNDDNRMGGETGAVRDDVGQQHDTGHEKRKSHPQRHPEEHDVPRGRRSGGEELRSAPQQVQDRLGERDGGDGQSREDQIRTGCPVATARLDGGSRALGHLGVRRSSALVPPGRASSRSHDEMLFEHAPR